MRCLVWCGWDSDLGFREAGVEAWIKEGAVIFLVSWNLGSL